MKEKVRHTQTGASYIVVRHRANLLDAGHYFSPPSGIGIDRIFCSTAYPVNKGIFHRYPLSISVFICDEKMFFFFGESTEEKGRCSVRRKYLNSRVKGS